MKKLVVGVLYAFCMLTAVHSGDINAQSTAGTSTTTTSSGTTPNLITSGTNHTWYGVTTGAIPADYMPPGSTSAPRYDPATNSISFSYGSASVGQIMAINQALANVGAGVKIGGFTYSYDVRNMNGDDRQPGVDAFTVSQLLRGPNNSVLLSSSQYYNTKFEWKTVSGAKTATTPYNIADTTYLQFGVQGADSGFWGGYFGPQIRNVDMRLNYVAAPITQHTMGDDGWVNVPLQFGFPFYGKVFTNSFMFDNGVVGFFDPVAGGCNPGNGYCGGQQWNSQPFSNNMGNQFSYMIAPLWADLAPNANTKYLTQGDTTYQKYTWENIGQYYDQSKLQTFDLTIKPSGFIGVNYGNVNLNQTNISVGTVGNPALGEYTQVNYYNAGTTVTGINNWSVNQTADACSSNPLASPSCPNYATAYLSQQCSISSLYNTSCPGYQTAYYTQQCSANPLYDINCPGYANAYLNQQCASDPLYSTTCQGYAQAYHDQQCSINPLFATDCTGYTTAYHDQQCSTNPLFATDCIGYGAAYLTQQCSANPLYSTQCSGYAAAYKTQQCTANSLYATDCPGYAVAYKTQQCTANALYASDCPGYAAAYKTQQCSISSLYATDCPGYADAYKAQQCSLNALYATDCPGYATAYKTQQCAANPLYATDCPGYDVSYKAQQCTVSALYATDCPGYDVAYLKAQCIQDSLYSTQCEGYKTAYAIKYLVNLSPAVTTAVNSTLTAVVETQRNDPANTSGITDTTVAAVVSTSTTSAANSTTSTTSISPVAVISTVRPAPPPTAMMAQSEPKKDNGPGDKKEDKKEEGKKDGGSNPNGGPSGDSKPSDQPKSNREALQERRAEAAKKEAIAKGKDLANEMGKASNMEAQKAIQNVVIAAMGFTPGFDTYNKAMLPDTQFYRPFQVYGGQVNVDNKTIGRRLMGGSDRLHQDMVDSQYNRGN